MKAVISIIGNQTDKYSKIKNKNPYYAYLTWDEIKEMSNSGYIEIQSHSYNLHDWQYSRKGAEQKPGESLETYKQEIEKDLVPFQNQIFEITGRKPDAFAYPFGAISRNSRDVLQSLGFRSTLSCREGVSFITRDPDCLYRLKRVCRTPGKTSEEFFKVIAPPDKKKAAQGTEQQID